MPPRPPPQRRRGRAHSSGPSFELRDADSLLTLAATAYAAAAHACSLALLCSASLPAQALGVLLATHGRVVAAVLVHDATHSSVFKHAAPNASFGALCLWLCVLAAFFLTPL